MDTNDLRLECPAWPTLPDGIMMLDLRANPVLHEEETDVKFTRIINLSQSLIQVGTIAKAIIRI
jgi:hypothetical protein